MKNKIAVSLLVILTLALAVWLFLGRGSMDHSGHENQAAQKAVVYTCPMHPQIQMDRPSSCPICGMDLVLLDPDDKADENMDEHAGHSHAPGEGNGETPPQETSSQPVSPTEPQGRTDFKLSLNKQQMIGVKTTKAEKKKLFKSIRAPGRIAFDPELYTAQSEYLEALRQWSRVQESPVAEVKENTRQMIESSKIRLRVLGLSNAQITRLAKKGFQSEGLLVGGQDNLIYANVFEVDLPYIKEDQAAQITANFLQGKTLPAKITSVDRVIDPETRTAKVRIELLESDPSIRPESYVNVTIFAPVGSHVAVPLEALLDTGIETYVFVKKGEGRFEPRKVMVGLETKEEAAIAQGLATGEEVVVGANFLLDSESRLKSVIRGHSQGSGHEH